MCTTHNSTPVLSGVFIVVLCLSSSCCSLLFIVGVPEELQTPLEEVVWAVGRILRVTDPWGRAQGLMMSRPGPVIWVTSG